jgi:phenylacetate-coenzyme A ligase PaaK-like adenylate-forming protein
MVGWLGLGGMAELVRRGGRLAMVVAMGGHFMAFAGVTQLRKANRRLHDSIQVFPVHLPLAELVERLNMFQPAVLVGYGSMLSLLAGEQAAGRLHITPLLLEPAGETLSIEERERLANVFRSKVRDVYGSTECQFLTTDCAYGWYHVNSDWAIVEPVDADYRPTRPGEQSHSVLISNLANRVQPILRYDLGDSILLRPDPCPCGNPLPALRVRGRAADVLTFEGPNGGQVALAPLALATLLDGIDAVELFQIVQTTPTELQVRLNISQGADHEHVWQAVLSAMRGLLDGTRLDHVAIERSNEVPEQSPGGKYRTVIPLNWSELSIYATPDR